MTRKRPLFPLYGFALACFMTLGIAPLGHGKELKKNESFGPKSDAQSVEDSRQKEAEEAKRLTELYLRNQSVFVRKKEFMLELNTLYSRNSQQTFVPVTGGVTSAKETSRFLDNTLIGRYGLLDGLELDVIAPVFVQAEQETDVGTGPAKDTKDGVGDIGGALRYEAWYERGNLPALVVDVSGKSNTGAAGLTGTGTWNAGGGVTLIKTMDPVVFFGRLGYTYNFPSQTRKLGHVIEYRVGMGFSLNDRVSFNIQLAGASIGSSSIMGTDSSGPMIFSTQHVDVMNLIFTTTVQVTRRLFIEPLVGVALTEQSFTLVGLRVPYRF